MKQTCNSWLPFCGLKHWNVRCCTNLYIVVGNLNLGASGNDLVAKRRIHLVTGLLYLLVGNLLGRFLDNLLHPYLLLVATYNLLLGPHVARHCLLPHVVRGDRPYRHQRFWRRHGGFGAQSALHPSHLRGRP